MNTMKFNRTDLLLAMSEGKTLTPFVFDALIESLEEGVIYEDVHFLYEGGDRYDDETVETSTTFHFFRFGKVLYLVADEINDTEETYEVRISKTWVEEADGEQKAKQEYLDGGEGIVMLLLKAVKAGYGG